MIKRLMPTGLRLFLTLAPAMAMTLAFVSASSAATPAQIDTTLHRAKAYLYSQMHDDNWEVTPKRDEAASKELLNGGQWGGPTAVAVYALLASGEDPQGPKLAPAIKWLKNADLVGTYALSMRCQVWLKLPRSPELRKLASADREKIQGAYNSVGRGQFLYGYLSNKRTVDLTDHSVSQYGVLSMWACAEMGIEIPTRYWADTEKRWTFDQKPDGGWFYSDGPIPGSHQTEQASMTAAGVATLFITQDYVHQADGIKCVGNIKNDHIDKGLEWMAGHTAEWAFNDDIFGAFYPGYTLYGVERIGVASGLKYFGQVDWYQFGADWCVKNQSRNGSWSGDKNIANTALCMLFLARGRAPLLINKVQYFNAAGSDAGKAGNWNQRPRDVANFVRWMGSQTERDVNWQVTNLDVPEDDLHDAPFLYFAGNKALSLKPEQVDKLKQYIERGGMILFNADCGDGGANSPFVASVVAMAKTLFPGYEFRDLPDSHPVFVSEQYSPSKWKKKPVLRGLSNGVRELMVILPGDPAKVWQLQESNGGGREELYQSVANLILYGTDKRSLLVKGHTILVTPDPAVQTDKSASVLRLKYNQNWDPEPGGWQRFAALVHNDAKLDLKVDTFELGDKPIPRCTIAHLTGTTTFKPTQVQQDTLKNFVQGGGTLVVDSAGGSSEFSVSVEAVLNRLFGEGLKDPMPAGDDVFKVGTPKGEIHYRPFARSVLGNSHSPQLKVIKVNNRNAVYYSRYDLSAGLVGESVDGITGYEPDSASQIMSGVILQTLKGK